MGVYFFRPFMSSFSSSCCTISEKFIWVVQKTKPWDSILLNLLVLVVEVPSKVDEQLVVLGEMMIGSEDHLELSRFPKRSVNHAFHSVLRDDLQSNELHVIHARCHTG